MWQIIETVGYPDYSCLLCVAFPDGDLIATRGLLERFVSLRR